MLLLILWIVIGVAGYFEASRFEKQYHTRPWGASPAAWGVICFLLGLIGALLLYLGERSAKKQVATARMYGSEPWAPPPSPGWNPPGAQPSPPNWNQMPAQPAWNLAPLAQPSYQAPPAPAAPPAPVYPAAPVPVAPAQRWQQPAATQSQPPPSAVPMAPPAPAAPAALPAEDWQHFASARWLRTAPVEASQVAPVAPTAPTAPPAQQWQQPAPPPPRAPQAPQQWQLPAVPPPPAPPSEPAAADIPRVVGGDDLVPRRG